MKGRKVAEKYAQALFELACEKDKLEEVTDEFKEIAKVVEENEDLQQVLKTPEITILEKKELLKAIFAKEVTQTTFNFLRLLVDKKRQQLIPLIYEVFKELADKEKQRLDVTVEAAVELSSNQKKKLKEKLAKSLGENINLEVEINKELIGGLILRTKNKVLDVSLLGELENLKSNLQTLEVS